MKKNNFAEKIIFSVFSTLYSVISLFLCCVIINNLINSVFKISVNENNIGIIGGADTPTLIFQIGNVLQFAFSILFLIFSIAAVSMLFVLILGKKAKPKFRILICIFSALSLIVFMMIPAQSYILKLYILVRNLSFLKYSNILYIIISVVIIAVNVFIIIKKNQELSNQKSISGEESSEKESTNKQWILIEDSSEIECIRNEMEAKLGHKSDKIEFLFNFSSFGKIVKEYGLGDTVNKLIPFDVDGNYKTTPQIELIKLIFSECMGRDDYIYAIDWHHSWFKYNPKINEPYGLYMMYETLEDTKAYFPHFYPNGDYYLFVSKNFDWGYLTHPWQEKVYVFGEKIVALMEEKYQNIGFIKTNE